MNLIRKLAVVLVALGSASVAQAVPIQIEFEGIAPDGGLVENITPYTEAGFLIDAGPGETGGAIQSATRPGINDNGTDIFWWCGGCRDIIEVSVSQLSGDAFSAISVDMSNSDSGIMDPGQAVLAIGHLSEGGTVTQTFNLVKDTWITFDFNAGFHNLIGLTFFANDFTVGDMAMDNLRLDGTVSVPIPPALYLFGSGLIGLIGFARRKA